MVNEKSLTHPELDAVSQARKCLPLTSLIDHSIQLF